MKRKALRTLFAMMCAGSVIAQAPNYTAAEAAKHIGETATVTDKVDSVHQSGKGNIFLNMGGKYPNQAFTVSFTDANNGTAIGWSGTIFRTMDGGQNWVIQSSGIL